MVALPKRPLGEGEHVVLIEATDPLGNTSTAETKITIDHSPPSASVTPAPGKTLKPGAHTFTVTLKDEVSGINHASTNLSVTQRASGDDVDKFFLVIKEGKFTGAAGLDKAGVAIQGDRFSFQLKGGVVPGRYIFNLTAADKKGNKMEAYRWTYTVRKGRR